jgi:hypothetical protein
MAERLGPLASKAQWDRVQGYLESADATPYGLAGGVWAADDETALAVARRLRTGQVDVNGARFNPLAPFGGYGQSGIGREMGRFGLDEYLGAKAIQLPARARSPASPDDRCRAADLVRRRVADDGPAVRADRLGSVPEGGRVVQAAQRQGFRPAEHHGAPAAVAPRRGGRPGDPVTRDRHGVRVDHGLVGDLREGQRPRWPVRRPDVRTRPVSRPHRFSAGRPPTGSRSYRPRRRSR